MKRKAAAHRRALISVLDQGLSSVSNFAILVFVARTSTVDAFGAFVLAYLLYGLGLGVQRAFGGEVLLMCSGARRGQRRSDARDLLGVILELSIAATVVLCLISFAVPSGLRDSMRAIALMLPILLLQDVLRYIFFANKCPSYAITMDALWLVMQAAAFGFIVFVGLEGNVAVAIVGWAFGAAVAAIYGAWRVRLVPRCGATRRWLRLHGAEARSFVADFLLLTGSIFFAMYAIGVVAGIAAVGAFRGAYVLFAPFDSLLAGTRLVTLPALARASARGGPALMKAACKLSLYTAGPAALWGAVAIALPSGAGEAILGATWAVAEPVLPALAIVYLGRTLSLPAIDGLRTSGSGRQLVTLRAATASLYVLGVVAGAMIDGARGAGYALAGTSVVTTAVWWRGLRKATRALGDIDSSLENPCRGE